MKLKDKQPTEIRARFILGVFFLCILFFLIVINLFMVSIKSTDESYSITQKWKEYHNIYNWNLPVGLPPTYNVDIDKDGIADSIRNNVCAFLSSVKIESIPKERKCIDQDYMTGKERVGQSIIPTNSGFGEDSLFYSFIVKTFDNKWKYYEYAGLRVNVSEKDQNNLFQKINPSFLDYVDLSYYQMSHIFLRLFDSFSVLILLIVLLIAFFIIIVIKSPFKIKNNHRLRKK